MAVLNSCKLYIATLGGAFKVACFYQGLHNCSWFYRCQKTKNSLFTDRSCPTLNRDRIRDQIWTLLLTVSTVVCFSLEIRVLQVILLSVSHSVQNFRLTARILNQSMSAARQHSCLLSSQHQSCKPSYFPFSHSRTFVLNPQCELFGSLSSQCSQSPIFSWNCLDIPRLTRLDCSQSSVFP